MRGLPRRMTKAESNWIGIVFGLCLAILAAYHQFKLPPVLPIFLGDYGYSPTFAGAFMSIYAVAGLTLSFGFGAALQGAHLNKYLQVAFALFIIGSLVTVAWPDNGWNVLAARGVEGIGFAVLAVAGPALCTAHAGRTGLPLAAALVATWIPAGALLSSGLRLRSVLTAIGKCCGGWAFSSPWECQLGRSGYRDRAQFFARMATQQPNRVRILGRPKTISPCSAGSATHNSLPQYCSLCGHVNCSDS